jgi:hypothetical protein
MMHRLGQANQWKGRAAARLWQQSHPAIITIATLVKEVGSRHTNDLILALGILIGTAAFGLWRQSFAAGLFAGIPLLFLAAIYRTTDQTLAAVRQSDIKARVENRVVQTPVEPALENSDALNEAIACLRPWVASEVSLTEENAKECCAVLLASIIDRAQPAVEDLCSSASNGNPRYSRS